MKSILKLSAATVLAASLAACAQSTAQNFDPPPAKRVDAKTNLESGRR
jgi:curli biogenesis system outer membrane secretion channel CsgG